MPREPDVFGHPTRPKSCSVAWTIERDSAHVVPCHSRDRIEIDAQLVGMVEVFGAHRMRMQLEAGEIGHPRQRRRVSRHDFFSRAPGRKAQRHDFDPRRPRLGCALLKEEVAVSAVGVADEHVGPPAGAAERTIGDCEVVVDEIELGDAGFGEQHLARIRDRHFLSRDDEPFWSLLAHDVKDTFRCADPVLRLR